MITKSFTFFSKLVYVALQFLNSRFFRYTSPDGFMTQPYGAYQYGYATGASAPPPQSSSPTQQNLDPNGSPNTSIQYPGQGESPSSIQFNQGQPANGHYIITNGYGFNNGLENGTYVSQIKPDEEGGVDQDSNQMTSQYHTVVAGNGEMLLSPSYTTQPYQYVLPEASGQIHQVLATSQPTSVAEQLPPVQAAAVAGGSPHHNLDLNMGSPSQQHHQQAPPAQYDSPEGVYNQSISSSESFTVKVESNQTNTLHPMG